MERNPQLGAFGCSCAVFALILVWLASPLGAQCPASTSRPPRVQELFNQHRWIDVVQWAETANPRTPDVLHDYGLALAHLQLWSKARDAFLEGAKLCPAQERFPVELAGVAFQQKRYSEAARWVRSALKLNPRDKYALDLAGSTYLLMGNIEAALKYWNPIQKPSIGSLQMDAQLRTKRLVLERAFVFSPQAVLERDQWIATQDRLRELGVFPAFHVSLDARPGGSFDASLHAVERDGFGAGPWQAALSMLSGLPYETVYPAYYNINRSAMNVQSLLRWDTEKRRAWASLSAPLQELPQWRWDVVADARNENWAIRRSFAGTAPVLASLNLEKAAVSGTVNRLQSAKLAWSMGGELSYRKFRNPIPGTALTSSLLSEGWQAKESDTLKLKLIDVPEHRFNLSAYASSETARLWSSPAKFYEKLQGSAQAAWIPGEGDGKYEFDQKLRAGRSFGQVPFDELYVLGVERDTDLWLRGEIATRDGRKGSSPLGTDYALSNTDLRRRIYNGGFFSIHAGPFFDAGRADAPTTELSSQGWITAVGVAARLTVLGTSVEITYGHNLSNGQNAFFATTVH